MKKLLIDVNSIVPYYVSGHVSGIGRTTLELIQALAKMKDLPFEVTLYSQNMKGIGGRNTGLPFKNCHIYLRNTEFCNKLSAKLRLREMLTQYDLMHIPHNFEHVAHPEKCIVTLHDALLMKFPEKEFQNDKMLQIVPQLIKKCKHVITCSKSSKNDIAETMGIPPEKITVIYWGTNHHLFYPQGNKKKVIDNIKLKFGIATPYFFSVSCNIERKRTNILVRNYISLLQKYGSSHDLVLVWGNPPQFLVDEIEGSGFAHRIHFLKNIFDEDLALLYNGATAMFFPSTYEGFGLPLLEAMACGTPVVTCRNSSLHEIADDAGIYLDEPLDASLMDVMINLENSDIDVQAHIEKGIVRAKQFTWERAAQQTIEVYSKNINI